MTLSELTYEERKRRERKQNEARQDRLKLRQLRKHKATRRVLSRQLANMREGIDRLTRAGQIVAADIARQDLARHLQQLADFDAGKPRDTGGPPRP